MFVTKEEFKNLDLYQVFFVEGHNWVKITDGRHTIHNVRGVLRASQHYALTFETRVPKYISKKIDAAAEAKEAAEAQEAKEVDETQAVELEVIETETSEEVETITVKNKRIANVKFAKLNDIQRHSLKKLLKLHYTNTEAAIVKAQELQPMLYDFMKNECNYDNESFAIATVCDPAMLERFLKIV